MIPPPIVEPAVPTPAPKEISPVGLSSTVILTILEFRSEPSEIFDLTDHFEVENFIDHLRAKTKNISVYIKPKY